MFRHPEFSHFWEFKDGIDIGDDHVNAKDPDGCPVSEDTYISTHQLRTSTNSGGRGLFPDRK